ncbi:MAG: CopG family transcriptional regulator [Syntrophus sp. (in: bacteria)]|nr:CopG family transcriptional regulator [Syntrophus sp. (in: bacteria)]
MKQHLKNISAKVPDDLRVNIDEIAVLRNRNRGEIVREALSFYIDTMADYRIALDRLKDPADEIQTEEEFLTEPGWDI